MVTTTKEETHKMERLFLAQESRKSFHQRCKLLCESSYKRSNITTFLTLVMFLIHLLIIIAQNYPPFSDVETEAMSSGFPGVTWVLQ